jgi:uncharacterized protein YbjQ (UPF0145 family)
MIQLGLIVVLLILGFFIGTAREKSHFKSLREREQKLNAISWRSTGRKEKFENVRESTLVMGHVVIGQDYFKSFLAGLVNIVGGRIGVYESLLDRGRREALCRLRQVAKDWGGHEVVNVRFETALIGQNQGKQKGGAVEIFAYGTVIK